MVKPELIESIESKLHPKFMGQNPIFQSSNLSQSNSASKCLADNQTPTFFTSVHQLIKLVSLLFGVCNLGNKIEVLTATTATTTLVAAAAATTFGSSSSSTASRLQQQQSVRRRGRLVRHSVAIETSTGSPLDEQYLVWSSACNNQATCAFIPPKYSESVVIIH